MSYRADLAAFLDKLDVDSAQSDARVEEFASVFVELGLHERTAYDIAYENAVDKIGVADAKRFAERVRQKVRWRGLSKA